MAVPTASSLHDSGKRSVLGSASVHGAMPAERFGVWASCWRQIRLMIVKPQSVKIDV